MEKLNVKIKIKNYKQSMQFLNKFLVVKLHFSFYNCHYFISQNVKIPIILLYSWCDTHFFPIFPVFPAK